MKSRYYKIAKKYNLKVFIYTSYLSDMGCRAVQIVLLNGAKKKEFDVSYWHYQKEDVLVSFEKEISDWLSEK